MKLILVRHGETEGNRLRQYIGRTDLPLNETGCQQAMEAGAKLRAFSFTKAYHSPSLRTRQTVELILQGRNVERVADERLCELDFGKWDGLTYDEIERRDREHVYAWYDDPWQVAPPEGETLAALDARVTSWLDDVSAQHQPGDTLLVVAHGGPLRWLLASYAECDPSRFASVKIGPGEHVIWQRGGEST